MKILPILLTILLFIACVSEADIQKAFNQGYQQGYQQGYSEGRNKGYQEAFNQGYQQGYSKGQNKGHEEGFQKGKDEGYKDGKDKGYNEGYDVGHRRGELSAYTKLFTKNLLVYTLPSIGLGFLIVLVIAIRKWEFFKRIANSTKTFLRWAKDKTGQFFSDIAGVIFFPDTNDDTLEQTNVKCRLGHENNLFRLFCANCATPLVKFNKFTRAVLIILWWVITTLTLKPA